MTNTIPLSSYKKGKPSKYRNKHVIVGSMRFDSMAEAKRYLALQQLERAGKITNLLRQPKFVLADKVRFHDEPRAKPALRYIADFSYLEGNTLVVEDVKSPATAKTAAFRIKRHLVTHLFGVDVRIVR